MGHSWQRKLIIAGTTSAELAASLEKAILEGDLQAGDRLPPVRELARKLALNRNTVHAAYARLKRAGLVVAGGRGGTVIAERAPVESWGIEIPQGVADLATGNVDPAFLPSLSVAAAEITRELEGYDRLGDDPELLSLAAERFRRNQLDSSALVVVSGATDGIERALRAIASPGDAVAIEDPGFSPVLQIARAQGLRLLPLPLDSEGVRLDGVRRALAAGARAMVLTPRAQNPTGVAMSAARAQQLAKLLDQFPEVLCVEDDHAADITEAPFVTVAPNNPNARPWLVVRSVSKSMGPDLRLAVCAGRADIVENIRYRFGLGPRWVSHILQRLVVSVWRDPRAKTLWRNARDAYRQRRRALIGALRYYGIQAEGDTGLHVWVPVSQELPVLRSLWSQGWAVEAGETCRQQSAPGIRICIGGLQSEQIDVLAAAVQKALQTRAGAIA